MEEHINQFICEPNHPLDHLVLPLSSQRNPLPSSSSSSCCSSRSSDEQSTAATTCTSSSSSIAKKFEAGTHTGLKIYTEFTRASEDPSRSPTRHSKNMAVSSLAENVPIGPSLKHPQKPGRPSATSSTTNRHRKSLPQRVTHSQYTSSSCSSFKSLQIPPPFAPRAPRALRQSSINYASSQHPPSYPPFLHCAPRALRQSSINNTFSQYPPSYPPSSAPTRHVHNNSYRGPAGAQNPSGEAYVITSCFESDGSALEDSNTLFQCFSSHIKAHKILKLPLSEGTEGDTTNSYMRTVKEHILTPMKERYGENQDDGGQEITIIWHLVGHGQYEPTVQQQNRNLWLTPTNEAPISSSRGLNFYRFEKSLEDALRQELPSSIRYNILYLIDSCQAGYALRGTEGTIAYALATPKDSFAFVRPSWTSFFCDALAKAAMAQKGSAIDIKAVVNMAIREGDRKWSQILYWIGGTNQGVVAGPPLWRVKVEGGGIFMSVQD